MRTIERNYRKNPHTANFLMTFHTAGGTNLGGAVAVADENRAEVELTRQDDLLDLVPVEHIADHRSPAQAALMEKLVREIEELDPELGCKTASWTMGMTEHGKWTTGREGNASAWIAKMIDKVRELRKTARVTAPVVAAQVPDGRYAVVLPGEDRLRFFKIKNYPRTTFVDEQASDDLHPVGNARKAGILTAIAVDAQAALVRYGRELGVCGDCGRTLTDDVSRAAGRGPVCRSK